MTDWELALAELIHFDTLMQMHLRRIEDEGNMEMARKFTEVFENLAIGARRVKREVQNGQM